jgi:hypothetical protein
MSSRAAAACAALQRGRRLAPVSPSSSISAAAVPPGRPFSLMTLVAVPGPNLRRVPTVDGVIFLLTEI